MDNDKLTIITINYNDSAGLQNTCNSIYDQQLVGVEHIIVDGSTDNQSSEILEKFRFLGSKIVSEPDDGIYDAMNKGIQKSQADFISFLNSGDVYCSKNVVEKMLEFIEIDDGANLDAFYGNKIYVNKSHEIVRIWQPGRFRRYKYLLGWMTPHQSTIIARKFYDQFGLFKPHYMIAADYDLMLRFFFKNKITPKYIDLDIVKMDMGGVSNKNLKSVLYANYEVLKSWVENGYFPPIWIFATKPLGKLIQYMRALFK